MKGEPGQIVIERHLVGLEAGGGVLTEEGRGEARQGQGVTWSAATGQLRSGWSI